MEAVRSSIVWASERDSLYVFRDPPLPMWQVDPFEGYLLGSLLLEIDEDEIETGRVAGVEILDFLDFDKWDAIPVLPLLWQLYDWQPLPLADLLQRLQAELRQQAKAGAA